MDGLPCPVCDRTLASPAGLKRHMNSQHTQEIWHHCDECNKRFRDPAGRSRCRRSHHTEFVCPHCEQRNDRRDVIKQHMHRRHQIPLEEAFPLQVAKSETPVPASPSSATSEGSSSAPSPIFESAMTSILQPQPLGQDAAYAQSNVYSGGAVPQNVAYTTGEGASNPGDFYLGYPNGGIATGHSDQNWMY